MQKNRILPIPDLCSGLVRCGFNPFTIQGMLNYFATGNRSEPHALVQRQKEILESVERIGNASISIVPSSSLDDLRL